MYLRSNKYKDKIQSFKSKIKPLNKVTSQAGSLIGDYLFFLIPNESSESSLINDYLED